MGGFILHTIQVAATVGVVAGVGLVSSGAGYLYSHRSNTQPRTCDHRWLVTILLKNK